MAAGRRGSSAERRGSAAGRIEGHPPLAPGSWLSAQGLAQEYDCRTTGRIWSQYMHPLRLYKILGNPDVGGDFKSNPTP